MRGFGIDLSGYTTGTTALAVLQITGRSCVATVLRRSPLSRKRKGADYSTAALKSDVAVLNQCLRLGKVAVDIPIDLQGLPTPADTTRIWRLTRRPVDRALKAMPPFADRIGAPVARFSAVMRLGKLKAKLGQRLFETYPSASFKKVRELKNSVKKVTRAKARDEFCRRSNINRKKCCGKKGITDDEIDAIICALAAVAPNKFFHRPADYPHLEGKLPRGFRILKKSPVSRITVECEDFENWMNKPGNCRA